MDSLSIAYLVGMDRAEKIVRIVDFLRFDPFTNPKHAQGAIKLAVSLPDSREKLNVLNDIEGCTFAEESEVLYRAIDSLSKPRTRAHIRFFEALAQDVRAYPDAYYFERAERFGVSERGIGAALKRLDVTHKKHFAIPRRTKTSGASSAR